MELTQILGLCSKFEVGLGCTVTHYFKTKKGEEGGREGKKEEGRKKGKNSKKQKKPENPKYTWQSGILKLKENIRNHC